MREIYDSYEEEERKANDSDVYLADTAVIVPKAAGDGKTGDQWVDGEPAGGAGHYDMSDMFQYPLCNTQAAYGQQKASYPISCGGYLTWPLQRPVLRLSGQQHRVHPQVHRQVCAGDPQLCLGL